jgi:hypothetical protein
LVATPTSSVRTDTQPISHGRPTNSTGSDHCSDRATESTYLLNYQIPNVGCVPVFRSATLKPKLQFPRCHFQI